MNFSSGIAIIFVVIGALVSQSQAAQATNSLRGLSEGPPDCRYGGKDYYANEWRVDCQLGKFDMCQCVYDWRKKGYRWSNCRNDAKKCSGQTHSGGGGYKSCSACVRDNNSFGWCARNDHCTDSCSTCKKYESNSFCEGAGYCPSLGSGPKPKYNKQSNTACGFGGYAREGKDMNKYERVSFSWCQDRCNRNNNCYGFDYDGNQRCRVFYQYPWVQKYKKGVTCYLAEGKGDNSW